VKYFKLRFKLARSMLLEVVKKETCIYLARVFTVVMSSLYGFTIQSLQCVYRIAYIKMAGQ